MADMITSEGTGSMDWGWVIFLILILWFFVGGGSGFFGNRCNGGYGYGYGYEYGRGFIPGYELGQITGENVGATHSEVERRQLVTAAETNFRIIEQGQLTRATVAAEAATTNAKIDFYAYQDLRDKLADQQRENMMLQNKLYSDAKFGAIEAQLACISNRMAVKPEVYTTSAVCPNAAVINGLGINSNSCPYNGNVVY